MVPRWVLLLLTALSIANLTGSRHLAATLDVLDLDEDGRFVLPHGIKRIWIEVGRGARLGLALNGRGTGLWPFVAYEHLFFVVVLLRLCMCVWWWGGVAVGCFTFTYFYSLRFF